mmetsp:Transcript_32252/g.82512  ORF Transcript_32252/g.82512 Transcript_32252/m.82512 type:complete len:166 (+) Transcript_32252:105-602(+)|eukprot:jgi/Tetstr1/434540/TSEL_023631.t1
MSRAAALVSALCVAALVATASGRTLSANKTVIGGGPNPSMTLGVSDLRYVTGIFKIATADGEWLQETITGDANVWFEHSRTQDAIRLSPESGGPWAVELDVRTKLIRFVNPESQDVVTAYQPILSFCDSLYCFQDNCQCYPWYEAPADYADSAPKLSGATWARGG